MDVLTQGENYCDDGFIAERCNFQDLYIALANFNLLQPLEISSRVFAGRSFQLTWWQKIQVYKKLQNQK